MAGTPATTTMAMTRGMASLSLTSSLRPLLPSRNPSALCNRDNRNIRLRSRSLTSLAKCVHRKRAPTLIRAMSDSSSSSGLEDSVKKTVSENPVVVYSKTWCSYSGQVKSLFRRLGLDPLVVELDQMGQQGSQIQKVLEGLTGQRTVPNVFIGGKHIGGCSDTIELYQKGELENLLSEANARKA
ncbi:PREDICTED: monothiol glutaredoxin-S10-like [Ipomoea nil]|uniref:monothiol glutaredoxin-S10-like n=1 Tax=Ipomoea nil TaxID=35883 RepID=UPI000900B8BA|nr:PREDICTED: monothiol glutaredoxin-S10-like [Ipomoea nil]